MTPRRLHVHAGERSDSWLSRSDVLMAGATC